MKAGFWGFVIFLFFGNFAWASDPADPGSPDTVYLECGGVTGGTLTIKVRIVTDNVGDSNKIVAIGIPLRITNSNQGGGSVLDTTLSATFAGSAVEEWESRGIYVIPIIDSIICDTFVTCYHEPSEGCSRIDDTTWCCIDSIACDTFTADRVRTFPAKVGVSSLTFQYASLALGPGGYLYANVKISVEDTTTICVDTFSYEGNKIRLTPVTSLGYTPEWEGICCKVVTTDFGYKPGDANCSGLNPNLSDILYLVNYVFKGGPAPCIGRLGDANCSGGKANLSDIIYLVSYVFKGGPAPIPCP